MKKLIGVVAGMALAVLGAEARAALPSKALAVVPAATGATASGERAVPVVKVAERRRVASRRAYRGGRRVSRAYRGGPRVARAYRGGRAWRGGRYYARPRYAYRGGWRGGPRWRYGYGYGRGWGYGGWGWGAAGVGVGLATGALIGAAYAAPPRAVIVDDGPVVALQPWTPAWYRSCRARYRSFNANTGYYVAYSGRRIFCR